MLCTQRGLDHYMCGFGRSTEGCQNHFGLVRLFLLPCGTLASHHGFTTLVCAKAIFALCQKGQPCHPIHCPTYRGGGGAVQGKQRRGVECPVAPMDHAGCLLSWVHPLPLCLGSLQLLSHTGAPSPIHHCGLPPVHFFEKNYFPPYTTPTILPQGHCASKGPWGATLCLHPMNAQSWHGRSPLRVVI